VVFFQILGLSPELRSSGRLKVDIFRKEAPFLSQLKQIGQSPSAPDFLELFPPGVPSGLL